MNKLHKIMVGSGTTIAFGAVLTFCFSAMLTFAIGLSFAIAYGLSFAGAEVKTEAPPLGTSRGGGWLKQEIDSPSGRLSAVITNASSAFSSSEKIAIDVKSNGDGESKHVGDFTDVSNLNVTWLNENTLSVKYRKAKVVDFNARSLNVAKQIVEVAVTQEEK